MCRYLSAFHNPYQYKKEYLTIKYVGGRPKGFTNSSKKKFIAQKNIDLNISWSSNFFWKIFHGLSHQFLFEAYL